MNPASPGPSDPPDPFDRPLSFGEGFGDLFEAHRPHGRSETGFVAGRSFRPAANIHETAEGLVITLDIPGIEREDVDLKIEGQRMIVTGKRDFIRDHADEEFVRLERGFGSFTREFELPGEADHDNVTARLENGVLTITVPGRQARRDITIETGEDGQ